MKRALTYILFLSFALTPIVFAMSVASVHAQPANAIDPKITAPKDVSCSFSNAFTAEGFGMCLGMLAHWMLLSPAAWAFKQVGMLLNYVVQELVFRMGAMTGMLEAVTIAWTVMRDIANVFLVFLVLFIGVATIVRATSYNSKQLLFRVIIAALLVNFSLYFAKVIIDVTNLFAAQTYIMILKEGLKDPITLKLADDDLAKCANTNQITPQTYESKCFTIGISGAIINMLRINTIFKDAYTVETPQQAEQIGWNILYIALLGFVLILILIFIFLAAIVLFISRFITLVYLMIISPVAFVSLVTGKFSFGKTWWNQLINNALFAPIYFLLLWVAILVISRMMQVYMPIAGPTGQTYSSLALANTGGFTLLIVFTVAAGLLIGALIMAKKLGVAGTNMATSFAGGVMFGTAALAYRQMGGRGSDWWLNRKDASGKTRRERLQDTIADENQSMFKRQMAMGTLKRYEKLASASGDLRQNIPGKAKKYFESNVGTLGEGYKGYKGTGGYAGMKKQFVEDQKAFGKSLGVDTKLKTELENELNGSHVEEVEKDANGNPVIDPTTGKPKTTRVWKEGVEGSIKQKKKDVDETQKEVDTYKKNIAGARERADRQAQRVNEAQSKFNLASDAVQRAAAQEELNKATAGRDSIAQEIAGYESGLATKQQELARHQAEGRALEDRRNKIQEKLKYTNRAYGYAKTLEKDAKSGRFINAPFLPWSNVAWGSEGEMNAAASAIRKDLSNQNKYRSTIDVFHAMKEEGILPEDVANQGIDALGNAPAGSGGTMNGGGSMFSSTPAPGPNNSPSGGAGTSGTPPSGSGPGTGPAPAAGGTPRQPRPTGGSGGTATRPNTGNSGAPRPTAQPFQRPSVSTPSNTASNTGTSRTFVAGDAIPTPARTDPRFDPNTTDPAKIRETYGTYLRNPEGPQATPQMSQPVQQQQAQARPTVSASTPPAFDPKLAALTPQRTPTTAQAAPSARPVTPVALPASQELLRRHNVPPVPIPKDFLGRQNAEVQAQKVFGRNGPFTDAELGAALQAQEAQKQQNLIDAMPPVDTQAGATGVRGMNAINYLQKNRGDLLVYDSKTGQPRRFNDALPSWNVENRGEGLSAWGTGYSEGLDRDVIGGKETAALINLIHGDGPYRLHPDIAARFGITQKPYEPTDKLGLNLPKKSV